MQKLASRLGNISDNFFRNSNNRVAQKLKGMNLMVGKIKILKTKIEAITITLIIQVNQHISKKAAKWKKKQQDKNMNSNLSKKTIKNIFMAVLKHGLNWNEEREHNKFFFLEIEKEKKYLCVEQ